MRVGLCLDTARDSRLLLASQDETTAAAIESKIRHRSVYHGQPRERMVSGMLRVVQICWIFLQSGFL